MNTAAMLCLLTLPAWADASSTAAAPKSFAYVLQADAFAKNKVAAVEKLAACDRDWLILDAYFSNNTPWERADLAALHQGRAGRKVLAYISIGEAEDYRPYWHKEWGGKGRLTAAAPAWLGKENPDWAGNYRVKYWNPEWQQLMLAAIDDAMARGFDGVYLDIVDAFEAYEQEGKRFVDDRVNPETRQSYRRDMVDWVKAIAARARKQNAAALVVPQNGSQLLAQADFLSVVSSIGIEDLFTEGDKLQPADHTRPILSDLRRLTAAHKPVLVIEYGRKPERRAHSEKQAQENGLVWLLTDRQLKTLGESGR